METAYLPVPWVYREVIEEEIAKNASGKVFYYGSNGIESAEGQIVKLEEVAGKGIFITLEPSHAIRIDRIITLFGKPGAAYEEYEAYTNACLSCTGGYEE